VFFPASSVSPSSLDIRVSGEDKVTKKKEERNKRMRKRLEPFYMQKINECCLQYSTISSAKTETKETTNNRKNCVK